MHVSALARPPGVLSPIVPVVLEVTALASHRDASSGWSYLVSGGGDGSVRVWHGKTRELLMQFTEHTKAVTAVRQSLDMHFRHTQTMVGS